MVEIDWRDDTKYHTVPQEIGNTTQCVKIMEIPTKIICTLQEQEVKGVENLFGFGIFGAQKYRFLPSMHLLSLRQLLFNAQQKEPQVLNTF